MNKSSLYRRLALTALVLLLVPLLIAAVLLQEIPEAVLSAATLLVTLVLGLVAPGLIDWIKKVLGVEGLAAFRVVLLISVIVAGVAMLIGGYFLGFQATAENILAASFIFLATVTYVYKALNPRPQSP
ncbi:MAG TPA: hypothetical protein VJK02_09010 [Anaerolineales bacterium]|nr:hypothetical protein [Anaerolineales bacterium]